MRIITTAFFLFIILCIPAFAQDTVQVFAGWNIIGSVKAGAVPSVLSTDPPGIIVTDFFGYLPGLGYQSTDTLGKGLGYWVKVSIDGIIVFNTGTAGICGVKTVSYGGATYRTVRIGSQCWLDRNLNIGEMINGSIEQTDNATVEKHCLFDFSTNCNTFGGLYKWDEAMQYSEIPGAQGICPTGWHVPTIAEFQSLKSAVGDDGNGLKMVGQVFGTGAGTDTTGFSAYLGGYREPTGLFLGNGTMGPFWSSTPDDLTAHYLYLINTDESINLGLTLKTRGYSLRCLEN